MDPIRTTTDPEPAAPCVIVTGGDPVEPGALAHVPPGSLVIGVDSGVQHALDLGLRVDVAVGDFDSLSPAGLVAVTASGARIERHPRAKDATDLELGLTMALEAGAATAVVLGGHGGRLDHLLANALLLAAPAFAALAVTAHMGPATVTVARPPRTWTVQGEPGSLVSLLPVGGPATGVVTAGLLYPLRGEDLRPGTTRGVSNELTDPTATVTLDAGTLLVVQPGSPT
jgi:thiamine pyrophosphokinase